MPQLYINTRFNALIYQGVLFDFLHKLGVKWAFILLTHPIPAKSWIDKMPNLLVLMRKWQVYTAYIKDLLEITACSNCQMNWQQNYINKKGHQ